MNTKRSYQEGCASAHALDIVGERWALLIVRELLFGPKRFTDLRSGVPGASPNVIAQRLRELETTGVLRQRRLGPPASTNVYELTEWGQGLEAVLVQLGRWGSRSPLLDHTAHRSVDALMLDHQTRFDATANSDLNATYALHIDDDHFALHIRDGRLTVARGEISQPDATISVDSTTYSALLENRLDIAEATQGGKLEISGDAGMVDRLFGARPNE
jgi:DNA-binding HxlR family transcriptional regulator